jgi:hypothetical protein
MTSLLFPAAAVPAGCSAPEFESLGNPLLAVFPRGSADTQSIKRFGAVRPIEGQAPPGSLGLTVLAVHGLGR